MLKAQRVNYIIEELERRYPAPAVPLQHSDPFSLLVAVLLSAQCTDERVNLVTPALFRKASTPKKMAALKVAEVQDFIKSCGLAPKKATAIVALSKMLYRDYNSVVPQDLESLESFPGVGHKTAQVVQAQAFGIPAFPVDTHIHRLAQLWKLTSGKSVQQTEKDLKKLFPKEKWNKLHLQIIYYGREHCQAKVCKGIVCPICVHLFPRRKKAINFSRA